MIPARVEYRIGDLSTKSRLLIFAAAGAVGIALQLLLPGAFFLGTLLMIAPMALLSAKSWTNKPADLGEEDWQPAGEAELDRIADSFRSARKIKIPFWYRPLSGLPATLVLLSAATILRHNFPRAAMLSFDAAILLWPALHFLRVRIWIPRDFELVIQAIQAARSVNIPEGVIVTPYLRLDRDAMGLRIPEDARLMVESRRKNEDLVGIQLQAAINSGPNGKVPYLYAVAITRGKGPSWRVAAAFKPRGYEVEPGGDDKFGTVVIRQDTSGGGYYTSAEDCRELMNLVLRLLDALKPR